MNTKPTITLVLASIVAFSFVAWLTGEYDFAARFGMLSGIVLIMAFKLSDGHLERILFGRLAFSINKATEKPTIFAAADYFNGWHYSVRFMRLHVEIHDCDEGEVK